MSESFNEKRRQQFLTEAYFNALDEHFATSKEFWSKNTPEADSVEQSRALAAADIADDAYMLLSLRYTAGEPIEALRTELTDVVEAYEHYQKALAAYEEAPDMSPLGLDQLGDYERAMQIMGLCVLLHRSDLLNRIAALIDPGYKGEDTLYEDILAFYQEGRVELDEWYHEEPYTPLIQAMYEEDEQEAARMLGDYCKRWYPAFKYIPWHDGHLRIDGTDGDYFGYWAFEAGAVAYLCNIDDSKIDHMVYPKDLVAWARANKHLEQVTPTTDTGLRVPGGQACPRAGWWSTLAAKNSRRYFKQGDVMPRIDGSSYGDTYWLWDANQDSPKL